MEKDSMHLGETVESRYEFAEEQIKARIRLVIVESKRIFITKKKDEQMSKM